MRHIGQGAIPRLVGLKEYVPPTSRELQEWMEEMEVQYCTICVVRNTYILLQCVTTSLGLGEILISDLTFVGRSEP